MDKRQLLEEAISGISNEYVAESLEYNTEKRKERGWLKLTSKAAAVALVIACAGTASVIATVKTYELKETMVDEKVIYFGGYVSEDNDPSAHTVGAGTPVSVETEQSDGTSEPWLSKSVETYPDGDILTKYCFESYEKAIAFFSIDSNFSNLPGSVESVEVKDFRKIETRPLYDTEGGWIETDLINTTLITGLSFGSGSYKLTEHYVVGAVAQNAYMAADLYEAGNKRTYINKNGVEFTLVDGYEEENHAEKEKTTKVLIGCDHYFGAVSFRSMKEKDIQNVLDCFNVIYTAPEYEHIHRDN